MTRQQVRGVAILLGIAVIFTAWRLWRVLAG